MHRMAPLRPPEFEIAPAAIDQTATFTPLEPGRLRAALDRRGADGGLDPGWDVRVVESTASTNSDLLREARGGHGFARPVVLAAEIQTAGRGRLGRSWSSAQDAAQSAPHTATPFIAAPLTAASLTASYALRVARRLGELEGISLVCGLAVRDALAHHGVHAGLKWPNDVLIDGRKLAGILVEAHALADATIVIVGVGINVLPRAWDASDARARAVVPAAIPTVIPAFTAIDLHSAGCALEDRNVLAADLAVAIEQRLARFSRTGFAAFASEWNAADAFRDRRVSLGTTSADAVFGIARGVDATGRLSIEIDGRTQRFIAGDLSLREAAAA